MMEQKMDRQVFSDVWHALEDTPAEASNMSMRAALLIAIEQKVLSWNSSQVEAATRLGITQPRLNDLLRGRVEKFSLDALVTLAAKAELSAEIVISNAG
jgi:predicted XRE-type DNA-binding protein